MKTVKSVADLKRLALERGAAVSVGGSRFNAGGEKVAPTPRAEPKSEPAAAALPPPAPAVDVQVDKVPVAQAIDRGHQLVAEMMRSVTEQLAGLRPGVPVEEWEFSINRNSDGTLASIRAKVVR